MASFHLATVATLLLTLTIQSTNAYSAVKAETTSSTETRRPDKMTSNSKLDISAEVFTVKSMSLCPSGWIRSTDPATCIKVHNDLVSWDDARNTCKHEGGDLVKIVHRKMNIFVADQLKAGPADHFWIGLNDRNTGVYHWLEENVKAEYTDWAHGEPNNYVESEDCGEIRYPIDDEGKWNDDICSIRKKFICERAPETKITPSIKPTTALSYTTRDKMTTNSEQVVDTQVFTVSNSPCSYGWISSRNSATCIKVHSQLKSWDDARDTCKAEGGDLVKIVNRKMNVFVADQLKSDPENFYWIGLSDRNTEGVYHWLDENVKAEYVDWGEGEPNNYNDLEDCGEIKYYAQHGRKWNDAICSIQKKFICERASETKITPSIKPTTALSYTTREKMTTKSEQVVETQVFTVSNSPCSYGWISSRNSATCIKVHSQLKSWDDARDTCKAEGGDLVKIVNRKMNVFVADQLKSDPENFYWIGLSDRNTEGVYHWLDENVKAEYVDWGEGEPNNYNDLEDCGEIKYYAQHGRKWNDAICSIQKKFICERASEINSSIAPMTALSHTVRDKKTTNSKQVVSTQAFTATSTISARSVRKSKVNSQPISRGKIAAAVICSIALAAMLVAVGVMVWRRRRALGSSSYQAPNYIHLNEAIQVPGLSQV